MAKVRRSKSVKVLPDQVVMGSIPAGYSDLKIPRHIGPIPWDKLALSKLSLGLPSSHTVFFRFSLKACAITLIFYKREVFNRIQVIGWRHIH